MVLQPQTVARLQLDGVFRTNEGSWLLGFMANMSEVMAIAELWTIWKALVMTQQEGIVNII